MMVHYLETPVGVLIYLLASGVLLGLCFLVLWIDLKRNPRGK